MAGARIGPKGSGSRGGGRKGGTPGSMPPQLRESYLHGKASVPIHWGLPHDFYRCLDEAKHHGIPARMRKGMCARLHKLATGFTPGHEPGSSRSGGGKGGKIRR